MPKFTLADIQDAEIVKLKSGAVVRVSDIRLSYGQRKDDYIVVAFDEWYPFDDIIEIIKKRK